MDKHIPYCNPEIWGGIESTINRIHNNYNDQLTYAGHYDRKNDIDLIAGLGIKKLRYPVLWEKHQPKKDSVIEWTWIEKQLLSIREKNIDVIAGLVHHGSGPSFTSLADKNFPAHLAEYAGKVAEKFPWINYYTPVNEPLTTARFSGLYGIWYPHRNNAKAFLQMLLNQLKAIVLSMKEIRKINPNAQLIQTEDLGKTYSTKNLKYQADFENERRWLTYDLLCGRVTKDHALWNYLQWLEIPEADLNFFIENNCTPNIFGFNHYLTSERFLDERIHLYPQHTHGGNGHHCYADVEAVRVELEEETGIEILLKEAWNRYRQPMAVTEIHLHCHREEQLRWFKYIWETTKKLRTENIDIKAITSWALLGSYGWNKLLTQPKGNYEPGAFDVQRGHLRPTALVSLIKQAARENKCHHHVTDESGWWQRSTRFIYQASLEQMRMKEKSASPILIIGKNGTLGKAFAKICEDRYLSYRLLSRQDCDISDLSSIEKIISHHKPWAIINAAGFVRVDDAEKEWENCFRDNTNGPHNLAIACTKYGVKLVSFSSDLVFDGKKNTAYVEDDPVNPINIYGKSKAKSEELVLKENPSSLIIRTSAFFGPWDEYNFIYNVRKSLSQYEPITVAKDIFISPTYVPHLVHATLDILIDDEKGIWHLTNVGAITWADLAYETAGQFKLNKKLINAQAANEINFIASRPLNSVLSSNKGLLLPTLEESLKQYFEEEKLLDKSNLSVYRA